MSIISAATSTEDIKLGQARLQIGIVPAQFIRAAGVQLCGFIQFGMAFGRCIGPDGTQAFQPERVSGQCIFKMGGMGAVDHVVGRPAVGNPVHCGDGLSQGLAGWQSAVSFHGKGDHHRYVGILGGPGDADGLFNVDETFLDKMNLKRLPSILGDNQFINTVKERFFTQKRHIEVPESKRLAPDTKDILNAVCDFYGINKAQLCTTKRGTINEARNMAIYLLRYLRGDSLTTIGKVFDIQSYSTASSIIERFKARMQTERKLIRKVEGIRKATMRQEKI
jgi:hypothetical protein